MKIGFIGLGKMGSQMTSRLLGAGHEVVVFDVDAAAVASLAQNGAMAAANRAELVSKLGDQVIIWLMIPSQFVDEEIRTLLDIVPAGSILIDGGNSDYRLTQARAKLCASRQVQLIDVGTSGGILGGETGFSMMVGGNATAVAAITPVLETLAQPDGWHHFGASGSGHYIKMVHNAIEYGLMEAYAEGYRLLKEGPYDALDLAAVGNVWQHGSIISSLLNELTASALAEDSQLENIDGYVAESGEARWALETARERQIPLPAIEAAFQVRLDSQAGKTNYATKLLAVMRNKFGGHVVNKDT
jgi:6-phosphogluconate dehydrogenase